MKTMTCAQMGGDCEAAFTTETPEEMMEQGMAHAKETHPELAAKIEAMTPEDPESIAWKAKFDTDWAAAPVVAAAVSEEEAK